MNLSNAKSLVGIALIAAATITKAGLIDITGDLNSLTFGNVTMVYDQIEGKIAADGIVNLTSYRVGYGSCPSAFSVIASDDVSITNGSVLNGGIYSGGSVNLTNTNVEGTIVENGTSVPVDFAAQKSALLALSTEYANTAATGSVINQSGNVFLTGNIEGINFFTLTKAEFEGMNNLSVDIPENAFAVINVEGSVIVSSWGDKTGNVNAEQVLYNFSQASSVTLNGSFDGSVLAAGADLTLHYGDYFGTLVSGSLNGQGELHMAAFTPPSPPPTNVPEPTLISLLGMGLLGLLAVRRKKQ